jgi:F-box protein 18 (helicase)
LWASMQDVRNQRVPMSHDGYLKLYGLSRPTIGQGHVLFDEAQDANGVIAGIILSHPGPICLTGDRHQSIYRFRGSLDVISELQGASTYALTRSFRFGDGIARVANHLLSYLGEPRRVVGSGHHATSKMRVDRSKPYAYIARTNMALLQAAIETLEERLPVYYVGGVENARLGLIHDGYHLYRGQHELIEDRFIKQFASLPELSEYATAARDAEMALLSKIVLTYADRIPSLLQQLRANAVNDIGSAQRILSTAHRSKGLEFDQVILASDYSDLMAGLRPIPIDRMDVQEVNLHYMAATRAMEALEVGDQLNEFVRYMERERERDVGHGRESAPEFAKA